jgi:hypothetical protein
MLFILLNDEVYYRYREDKIKLILFCALWPLIPLIVLGYFIYSKIFDSKND